MAGEGGTLWLATYGGLIHFDPATGRRQLYPTNTRRADGLGGDGISRVLQDRQQNLWIGTVVGGLHRLDRTAARATRLRHDAADATSFPGTNVLGLAETPNGDTWAATDSGLVRLPGGAPGAARVVRNGAVISSLLVDRTGRFWGSGQVAGEPTLRVFALDPQTGRVLARFPRDGEPPLPYFDSDGNPLAALAEGPGRTLWVGTYGAGLMRLDPATGRFHRYPFRRTERAGVSDSLAGAQVISLVTDRSGALWIGTNRGGISRLDVASGRFTSYFYQRRSVRAVLSIHEDRRGRLWLGTYIERPLPARPPHGRAHELPPRRRPRPLRGERDRGGRHGPPVAENPGRRYAPGPGPPHLPHLRPRRRHAPPSGG